MSDNAAERGTVTDNPMDRDTPRHGLVSRISTDDWEHALITGNGRQGALCYGGPAGIRVTLSHERLFLPVTEPLPPPATAAALPDLRALLLADQPQAAADLVCALAAAQHSGYAQTRWIDPFIGAATLTFTPRETAANPRYRRYVDFETGVVTQRWRTPGGETRVDVFVARPADVVVIRLAARGGEVTGRLSLDLIDGTPPVALTGSTTASAARLTLRAEVPHRWAGASAGYAVACRILAPGAQVDVAGDAVEIHRAREVLLLVRTVVADADHDGAQAVRRAERIALADLTAAVDPVFAGPTEVEALYSAHVRHHGDLFGRCTLDLGGAATRFTPSETLLAAPVSPALVERLFDAGRYAIISSCGARPPTLQGVWSGTYDPPWCSGYTLDGNLATAVAALLPSGTPELLLSLFDLVDEVREDLRTNARRLYDARGLLTPAHMSSHGLANHFGPTWCLTFWTAGAAWLGRFYYDYWRYTGDRDFLANRAVPFLAEAADFYLDFLIERDGRVSVVPSYSPENTPDGAGPQAAVDATMDVAVIADLLRNLLEAVQTLGLPDARLPRWRALLAALPPYRINADGELAEWLPEHLADHHAHRHASHLYPLWYELDPALAADPALRAAAAAAVEARLAWWRGADSDEMAFGLVSLGLAAAQLGLAEAAYETVTRMARYWRPNLVATHNLDALFNVDICGGLPAVVLAMLVRSGRRRVDLLPALPAAWPSGEVCGVAARDQITVRQLTWRPGQVTAVVDPGPNRLISVGAPPGTELTSLFGATVAADGLRTTPGAPVELVFTHVG